MKTTNLIPIGLLVSILLMGSGCASILSGNDPVVVRAEQTEKIALATFDTFLAIEAAHQAEIQSMSPIIHTVAENVRKNGKNWLTTANNLRKTYKSSRTPENKANLMTAIAIVETALTETQKYLVELSMKGLK